MSPDQFREWVEFYGLEPWGFEVDDYRSARLTWATLAAAGAKKAGGGRFTIEDFRMRPRPPMSVEEQVKLAFSAFPRTEPVRTKSET